jgi:hypothetical protein
MGLEYQDKTLKISFFTQENQKIMCLISDFIAPLFCLTT